MTLQYEYAYATLKFIGKLFRTPVFIHPGNNANHEQAAAVLIAYLRQRLGAASISGIGHRVVHGGVHLLAHQLVTPELLAELYRTQPLDLAHLPREIALIEAFRGAFPNLPQVACFDTAFHRDMPRVAQLLPIPRHYYAAGVRRSRRIGLRISGEIEKTAPADENGRPFAAASVSRCWIVV